MFYQLIKRDPVWKDARWVLLLCAVLCAVPPIRGMDFGALYGPLYVVVALFLAMPHRRATLFEGVLPIPARNLFLARAVSVVTSIWLTATVAVLSMTISSGVGDAARRALLTASLCTLAAAILLSIHVRDLAGPVWTLAALYTCCLFSFLLKNVPALLPALCALAGIALLAGVSRAVPKSFQISAGKPAAGPMTMALPAFSFSPRLAWRPVIRSVFSIPYVMMCLFAAFQALPVSWFGVSFSVTIAWLAARTNTCWLRTLPVHPRSLLAAIVTPLLLASAAGYLAGFHIGRHPRPAPSLSIQVLELGAMLAWELAVLLLCAVWDWRRFRLVSPKGRTIGLLTTVAVVILGGFLVHFLSPKVDPRHSVLLLAAATLPGGLAAAVALSAAVLAVAWWALGRVFAEGECTDKPRPAKLFD